MDVDAVVIGAGQAGLSAAYHLRRRGLVPGVDFVVLDANPGPGGAWQHRWDSLTFGAAHALHDLPGMALGTPDPAEPASSVVRRYYGRYEAEFGLRVLRPVAVAAVEEGSGGRLAVRAADGRIWQARTVINATGTWDRPYWPYYPGRSSFRGRQLHTRDFQDVGEFAGQRVLVVGGGTSAVQFLLQLDRAGISTVWSTRRPPEFTRQPFDAEWGRGVEARVRARTRAGLPPLSVVSATGLPLTEQYLQGIRDGVLVSRGKIAHFTPEGVVFTDGTAAAVDTVLWATGFRAALEHLAPLHLRGPGGGIRMDGPRVVAEPRLFLVGYGESSSTLGATRAGRAAAVDAMKQLRAVSGAGTGVRAPAPPTGTG